jgi:hypothetical protein
MMPRPTTTSRRWELHWQRNSIKTISRAAQAQMTLMSLLLAN